MVKLLELTKLSSIDYVCLTVSLEVVSELADTWANRFSDYSLSTSSPKSTILSFNWFKILPFMSINSWYSLIFMLQSLSVKLSLQIQALFLHSPLPEQSQFTILLSLASTAFPILFN